MYKRMYEWNVCFARGQVGSFGFQKVGASAGRTQCAEFSEACGPGPSVLPEGPGGTLVHSEGNSLAESWEMEECLNGFLEQFAKSPNVCHLLCTYARLLLI